MARKAFKTTKVSRVGWWMGAYGAPSAKRQFAYSNSPAVRMLDSGKQRQLPEEFLRKKISTTYRYVNSAGKQCWNGTGDLKGTKILVVSALESTVRFAVVN